MEGLNNELVLLGFGTSSVGFSDGMSIMEESTVTVDSDGVESILFDDPSTVVCASMEELKHERLLAQAVLHLDEIISRREKGFSLVRTEEARRVAALESLNNLVEGWNVFISSEKFKAFSPGVKSKAWDGYKKELSVRKAAYHTQKDKVSKYWDRINSLGSALKEFDGQVWALWYIQKDEESTNKWFTVTGDMNSDKSWEVQAVNHWDEYAMSHLQEESKAAAIAAKFVWEIEGYGLNLDNNTVSEVQVQQEEQFVELFFQNV
jgi:hypothetical protein